MYRSKAIHIKHFRYFANFAASLAIPLGKIWVNNYEQYFEEINQIMNLNKNKLSFLG